MNWIARTDATPDKGETVGVYDAFHVGLSTGTWNGEMFDVKDNEGRGTFVTHWTPTVPPSGGPDPEEVHAVCKKHFS